MVCWGKYGEMKKMLEKFEKEHFDNMTKSRQPIKVETAKLTKQRKLSIVEHICRWLVDDTGIEDIPGLLGHLSALGRTNDGYIAVHPLKAKSAYFGYFLEFIRFMYNENEISQSTYDKCAKEIATLQWNLSRKSSVHRAKYQEKEKEFLVEEEDIEKFYKSSKVKNAQHLLKTHPKPLKMRQVSLVRNYLLTKLMIENVLRPCSLYRLGVKQFLEEEKNPDKESGLYEYPLFADKTVGATGKANYLHLSGRAVESIVEFSNIKH